MSEKPDAVVSEETARKSVDRITKAVVDAQKMAGAAVPDPAIAEDFARQCTGEAIKKHEEKMALAAITAPTAPDRVPQESASRLDREEVGDDMIAIHARPLDKHNPKNLSPQARKHLFGQAPLAVQEQLIKDRVELLGGKVTLVIQNGRMAQVLVGGYPDWQAKLTKAYLDGDTKAMTSGVFEDRVDPRRRGSIIADEVMKVLEESNATFGDYRFPKTPEDPKIIIG